LRASPSPRAQFKLYPPIVHLNAYFPSFFAFFLHCLSRCWGCHIRCFEKAGIEVAPTPPPGGMRSVSLHRKGVNKLFPESLSTTFAIFFFDSSALLRQLMAPIFSPFTFFGAPLFRGSISCVFSLPFLEVDCYFLFICFPSPTAATLVKGSFLILYATPIFFADYRNSRGLCFFPLSSAGVEFSFFG